MPAIIDLVPTLQLGQRVRFNATLEKTHEVMEQDPNRKPYDDTYRSRRVWSRRERFVFGHQFPNEGVVVGARTVFDGDVNHGDWETPTTFTHERSHRVYLVATELRGKHLVVSVEDIEPVPA
ncbi:hypothetical protein [Curtobacterium sp. MCBD17_040]|uniref:hypothetical protein n=1 Tax=Curtobacterium sp. MCBD17_040 TaxID=2175674 RepID=UPI000DAA3506|nr:hypothetical protein [Curtobacterium sp. MCBD17_040]WIB65347.1 hypothetical protein DEI94_18240 [Curtobacterium sp. MCBD17_040]